jgi:hypothetical protein
MLLEEVSGKCSRLEELVKSLRQCPKIESIICLRFGNEDNPTLKDALRNLSIPSYFCLFRELWDTLLDIGVEYSADAIIYIPEGETPIEPIMLYQLIQKYSGNTVDYISSPRCPFSDVHIELYSVKALKESVKLPLKVPQAYSDRFNIQLLEDEEWLMDVWAGRGEYFQALREKCRRLYLDGRVSSVKEALEHLHKGGIIRSPFERLMVKNVKKILLLQTAKPKMLENVVKLLKMSFKDATISLMNPESIQFKFNIFREPTLKNVRKERYDLVAVPYDTLVGLRHDWLHWFAINTKARYKIALYSSGKCRKLNLFNLITSIKIRRKDVFDWMMLITGIGIFFAVCLTIARRIKL